MLQADLFIGTSSGFAAMANFSKVPYFITKMNDASCGAYGIEPGSVRLPFAEPNQVLVYETETKDLLMGLLEKGLAIAPKRALAPRPVRSTEIDVSNFHRESSKWLHPAATTSRFFIDDLAADQETAFLVWPKLQEGFAALGKDDSNAPSVVQRILANFPRLHGRYPELGTLDAGDRLSLTRRLRDGSKRFVTGLNANILPAALRETPLHNLARRVKYMLVSKPR